VTLHNSRYSIYPKILLIIPRDKCKFFLEVLNKLQIFICLLLPLNINKTSIADNNSFILAKVGQNNLNADNFFPWVIIFLFLFARYCSPHCEMRLTSDKKERGRALGFSFSFFYREMQEIRKLRQSSRRASHFPSNLWFEIALVSIELPDKRLARVYVTDDSFSRSSGWNKIYLSATHVDEAIVTSVVGSE